MKTNGQSLRIAGRHDGKKIAFTGQGNPNSGVIIGDTSAMIIEAQATPRLAAKVIDGNLTEGYGKCITITPSQNGSENVTQPLRTRYETLYDRSRFKISKLG